MWYKTSETEEEYILQEEFEDWKLKKAMAHESGKCCCECDNGRLDTSLDCCIWGLYTTSNINDDDLFEEFMNYGRKKHRN